MDPSGAIESRDVAYAGSPAAVGGVRMGQQFRDVLSTFYRFPENR